MNQINSPPIRASGVTEISHATQISNICNILFTSIFAIVVLFLGIIYNPYDFWGIVFTTLFSCLPGSVILVILKVWLLCHDEKNQTGVLRKFKRDYVIGCGGTILITCFQLTSISCIGPNAAGTCYFFFVCNVSTAVLHYLFILELESQCRLKYKGSHCYCVSFILFCVLTSFLIIVILFEPKNAVVPGIMFILFFYPLIVHAYTLWTVFGGRIELLEMRNFENCEGRDVSILISPKHQEQQLSPPEGCNRNEVSCSKIDETSPKETTQSSGLECEICMLKYDGAVEKQTPRILIKCGHTLCQECIENILKQYNQQHIFCPFCQQVTVVDEGDVTNLPKNYGMLRLVQ